MMRHLTLSGVSLALRAGTALAQSSNAPVQNVSLLSVEIEARAAKNGNNFYCDPKEGHYATDNTLSWEPTCFGVFVTPDQRNLIGLTRGTAKNPDGSPKMSISAPLIVQAQSDGGRALEQNGMLINMDVAGGAVSAGGLDTTAGAMPYAVTAAGDQKVCLNGYDNCFVATGCLTAFMANGNRPLGMIANSDPRSGLRVTAQTADSGPILEPTPYGSPNVPIHLRSRGTGKVQFHTPAIAHGGIAIRGGAGADFRDMQGFAETIRMRDGQIVTWDRPGSSSSVAGSTSGRRTARPTGCESTPPRGRSRRNCRSRKTPACKLAHGAPGVLAPGVPMSWPQHHPSATACRRFPARVATSAPATMSPQASASDQVAGA
jgi:hypothetical protein